MPPEATLDPVLSVLPPDLCSACVGRMFARTDPAPSNADRGRRLRPGAPDPGPDCPLCEGIPARIEAYARLCIAAASGVEHDTFLVGSVLHPEIRRREEAIHAMLVDADPSRRRERIEGEAAAPSFATAEFLKAEVNRETGKRLEVLTGRKVEFNRPHVTFEVDTRLDHVRLRVASLHLRGRYRKHDRTLPQTRWPCRSCNGIGCRACEYRGKTYDESVEELVAAPFLEASGASDEAFHGMGREDIDARMLGTGRPFVLELKSPRTRTFDCVALAREVHRRSGGRVEALEVAPTDHGAPARYKDAAAEKTYHAACVANGPVDRSQLEEALKGLEGVELDQRTPDRVAHRRADLVRKRTVLRLRLLEHAGERFTLDVHAESGTYIKEFVSGDEGRTRPSVAERLGTPCKVEALDVVAIDWTEPGPSVGL